jgi:membrane protein DedA with SNARE-associated domain
VVGWSYPKSMLYIVLGSAAKYSVLLLLVGYLGLIYDPDTATLVTVAAILILIVLSVAASYLLRRRAAAPPSGSA